MCDPFYYHTYISRVLDRAENNVKNGGAAAFAEALKVNTALETLNLSCKWRGKRSEMKGREGMRWDWEGKRMGGGNGIRGRRE